VLCVAPDILFKVYSKVSKEPKYNQSNASFVRMPRNGIPLDQHLSTPTIAGLDTQGHLNQCTALPWWALLGGHLGEHSRGYSEESERLR
jgi:hypothetical protein